MKKKATVKNIIYIVLFLALCLLPLVLWPLYGHQKIDVDGKDAAPPAKMTRTFLSDWGNYFALTFAFRGQLIDCNTYLRQGTFHSDTDNQAILGKEGYLYYRETLDDYTASHTMSDGEIANLAYDFRVLQEELSDRDKAFLFTIAPNKNSVYPQFMQGKYKENMLDRNSRRLVRQLALKGVNYVSMFRLFRGSDHVMYHKLDSHWTNEGAALAMDAILTRLGKKHTDYSKVPFTVRKDFSGDLYKMAHPTGTLKDDNVYYDKDFTFTWTQGDGDVTASDIRTKNKDKNGSLLMFRDSFGNALSPFMAEEYGTAHISKALPYDAFLAEDDKADAVVGETVERHLPDLARQAPVIAAKPVKVELPAGRDALYKATVKTENSIYTNFYTKIYGTLDERKCEAGGRTYVILTAGDQQYILRAFRGGEGKLEGEASLPGYAVFLDPQVIPPGKYQVSLASERFGRIIRSKPLKMITLK